MVTAARAAALRASSLPPGLMVPLPSKAAVRTVVPTAPLLSGPVELLTSKPAVLSAMRPVALQVTLAMSSVMRAATLKASAPVALGL
jgi:hypothetical protein